MKRAHLISVVIAMLFILPFAVVSCSNSGNGLLASTAVSSVEIVTPTTTPTPTPTIIPTPTPTITPTPTPIPTLTHSAEDDLAMAPDISGLSKEIQDGKVVYKAVDGNEYGIEVGKYAGKLLKNVLINGEEAEVVALIPTIAKYKLEEALKLETKKLEVVIPVDSDNINISEGTDNSGNTRLEINSEKIINIYNILLDSSAQFIYWYNMDGIKTGCIFGVGMEIEDIENAKDGTMMYFLQTFITANESTDETEVNLEKEFGEVVAKSSSIQISLADSYRSYPVTEEDILMEDGAYIGITSEE